MSANEEIIDYTTYSVEIEKWLALKGETKYMRFAGILKDCGTVIEWNTLKDTYRYDKRLLVNIFKYLSFFEEFLRAQVWNVSQVSYKKLESAYLADAIDKVITLKNKIHYLGFSIDTLAKNRDIINYLRNSISHNKIVLASNKDGKTLKDLLIAFKETLPESYQKGFASDINDCASKLNIPSCLIIEL